MPVPAVCTFPQNNHSSSTNNENGRRATQAPLSHSLDLGHLWIERRQGAHHAAHDGHGVGIVPKPAIELDQLLVHQRVVLELTLKQCLLLQAGVSARQGTPIGACGPVGAAQLEQMRAAACIDKEAEAHSMPTCLLGSSPCSRRKIESIKSPSAASSSIGYLNTSSVGGASDQAAALNNRQHSSPLKHCPPQRLTRGTAALPCCHR